MRNRLKKSHRADSVSSTKSGNRRSQDGKQADATHRRTPSAPAADAPSASPAGSSAGTMSAKAPSNPAPTASPSSSSLSPLSSSQLNSGATASHLSRTLSTIRAVTGLDDKPPRPSFDDEASSVGSPSVTQHSASAFSSSVNSNVSTASFSSHVAAASQSEPPSDAKAQPSAGRSRAAGSSLAVPESTAGPARLSDQRKGSGGFGIPAGASSGARAVFAAAATGSPSAAAAAANGDGPAADDDGGGGGGGGAWDSTIGKAGLGKTGRVINRLVSDNEALKRDLQIERLKADEARQAARLLEDKMERLVSEYETRLLEANVNKTLLARKERQVESLQGAVALEKKRTADAQARESSWRAEMDKVRAETKQQVEAAATQAALADGRYEAIRSHWREQGADVRRAADRMGAEVRALAAARRDDDDKISRLRDLCDQQDGNIRGLQAQKEALAQQFAAYKAEQERLLHAIKTGGAAREAEQERMLAESREVLDKLKWALKIKETIAWAE